MSVLNYAVADNLPAPVTVAVPSAGAGTGIQSFTDTVTGEVWVAKAGVRNGNWYRARDVLVAVWYRAGAYSTATGSGFYGWDTATTDVYGMYIGGASPGVVTPIPGLWRISTQIGFAMTAASQLVNLAVCAGSGGGTQIGADYGYGCGLTTGNCFAKSTVTTWDFAGDILCVKHSYSTAALAGLTGALNTNFTVEYVGTG